MKKIARDETESDRAHLVSKKEKSIVRLVVLALERATTCQPAYDLLWVRGPINRICQSAYDPTTPRAMQVASVKFTCPHVAPMKRKRTFFLYEAILKNILSTSYYFLFENRLHQYVLRDDEQN